MKIFFLLEQTQNVDRHLLIDKRIMSHMFSAKSVF